MNEASSDNGQQMFGEQAVGRTSFTLCVDMCLFIPAVRFVRLTKFSRSTNPNSSFSTSKSMNVFHTVCDQFLMD